MKEREYDIIVFGATGFTGKLVVEYIIEQYGLKNNRLFRWAIAGRDVKKLENLKSELLKVDGEVKDLDLLVADSIDDNAIDKITQSARLIISTVGPYIKYGKLLVSSCANNGTHYCDLTGEVPFIRESIDSNNEIAKENNCKIIHSCGFDSIPSDLGVLLIQKEALEKYKIPCKEIKYYVRATSGGLSGGTIASMIAISAYIKSNPSLSSLLGNAYALNSTSYNGPRVSSLRSIKWDDEVKLWLAPFIMSGINTRIVRRSNEMLKFKYGKEFLYSEVTSFSKGFKGYIKSLYMLVGLGLAKVLMSYRPTFLFLRKFILPSPGEGPTRYERENGFFKIMLVGKAGENKISCSVIGDRDPGYSGTAKMLTEAALSIILDQKKIPQNYGVLTPASGIGMTLINRLESKGVVFKIC